MPTIADVVLDANAAAPLSPPAARAARGDTDELRAAAALAAVPAEPFGESPPPSGAVAPDPQSIAAMLSMLDVQPGARVLEVGAGDGHRAAVLAHLAGEAGRVVAVEPDRRVAATARENLLAVESTAKVVVGDGRAGIDDGSFERILVTTGTEMVPRSWFDQLAPGGLLVVPLRLSTVLPRAPVLVALRRVRNGFDPVATTVVPAVPPTTVAARQAPLVDRVVVADPSSPDAPALVDITGPALAGLGPKARRALVLTSLGFRRDHVLDLAAGSAWAAETYVALTLPEERLVEAGRAHWGPRGEPSRCLGTLAAVDGSLAFLVAGGGVARIEMYGGEAAARALGDGLRRWVDAGRPGAEGLSVTVRYGSERPHAWRSLRRADQWLAVDWASPDRTTAQPG